MTDEQPEKQSQGSFLVQIISGDEKLSRACTLLCVSLISFLVFVFLLKFIVFDVIDRLSGQIDTIKLSEQGSPIIKLKGKKELQVITVPAYNGFTDSGITINRSIETIEIKATGSVSTGLGVPFYLEGVLYDQFKKSKSLNQEGYSELGWRIARLEFNEYSYLGWRGANGKELQKYDSGNLSSIYASKCIQEESDNRKLLRNEDYGILLGFVAQDEKSARKIFKERDEAKIFVIGEGAKISYNSKDNFYLAKSENKENEKLGKWENGKLYFAVNDTVIADKNDFNFTRVCEGKDTLKSPKNLSKLRRDFEERYKILYEKLKKSENSNLSQPQAIWYLDNKGSFTVNTLVNQK